MKVAIMQPYFFPYIGYFQLIAAVDKFVIYDDVKYTKKGWINRNRFLLNGTPETFSIPLKKDSDFLSIKQRNLSDNYLEENAKTLRKILGSYNKSPYKNEVEPLLTKCFQFESKNLFSFIYNSLINTLEYLEIDTEIIISSKISGLNNELKGVDKVKEICKILNANDYINPIGGTSLYDKKDFGKENIELHFIQTSNFLKYSQLTLTPFVPSLSIIDVLMHNSKTDIKFLLTNFDLL